MQELNITTHKDTSFEQMTVTASYTERKALLTRIKGEKVWSVRGRKEDADGVYALRIATAQKAKALEAARWFIEFNIY